MVYTKVGFALTASQKEAIKQAYVGRKSVRIFLGPAQLSGRDFLGLTKAQRDKVAGARRKRSGVELTLSRTQVSKQGGFLGGLGNLAKFVAPFLLKKVLPALGLAAATGAISGAAGKATRGKGVRTPRRTRGDGLLLGKKFTLQKYTTAEYFVVMAAYFDAAIGLTPYQKSKIATAVRNNVGTSIQLSNADLSGPHKIRLTQQQITRIKKAKAKGAGIVLKLSKTQLTKQGGFLGALFGGLAAALLPQLLGMGMTLPGTPISGRGKKMQAKGLMSPPFVGRWPR